MATFYVASASGSSSDSEQEDSLDPFLLAGA